MLMELLGATGHRVADTFQKKPLHKLITHRLPVRGGASQDTPPMGEHRGWDDPRYRQIDYVSEPRRWPNV
eukprot:12140368-Alexandrium_andersonii.AAC.1